MGQRLLVGSGAAEGITRGNDSYHSTSLRYRAGSVEMDLSRTYYFSMVYIFTLCLLYFSSADALIKQHRF